MEKTKKVWTVYIVILLVIAFFMAVKLTQNEEEGWGDEAELTITNSNGNETELTVEVARTWEEKTTGLSQRESLPEDSGMLFVFDEDVDSHFTMEDTSIPLSIAFIDKHGDILDIQKMEPLSDESYSCSTEYRYALEVSRGFFEENDIQAGDNVDIRK
ncbi:MAG: DUF192 domain-containing protein [Thermoplasmata archaeon]